MSRKVLVTGADGFIGSHLVEMLVRDGYDVRAFVYYNSFNSWGWLDRVARLWIVLMLMTWLGAQASIATAPKPASLVPGDSA